MKEGCEFEPSFVEYCEIMRLKPNERDQIIFLAGKTFQSIETNSLAALEAEKPAQHTKCAVCLEDNPTPIRNDRMGGYVCLSCVDKEIERLQALEAEKPSGNKEISKAEKEIESLKKRLVCEKIAMMSFKSFAHSYHLAECAKCKALPTDDVSEREA